MKIDTIKIVEDIYNTYLSETANEAKRRHLGASALGDKCMRNIWYDFRWYFTGMKDGRILRLFNTGKREEIRVVENLLNLGFMLFTENDFGRQIECRDSSGHIGGSVDGIIYHIPAKYGSLDADKCILEIKTHSEKNFRKLTGGIKNNFPKHYTQVQVYMGLMNIPCSLYVGVNKNTDEMYFEMVHYDKFEHDRVYSLAKDVLLAPTPPDRIRENPTWFECKMCKFHDICHTATAAPKNCRTCVFSRPIADGKWTCDFHNKPLSYDEQVLGCESYKVSS
jgi:hypothetical protein